MATPRDPATGWVDPDEFDRATDAAVAAAGALDRLETSSFTDPHSTTPDGDAPGPISFPIPDLPSDDGGTTFAEMLAAAADVDPDRDLDETAFGGGARPGIGPPDDDVRLGPDLLPDRIDDHIDDRATDVTPSLESMIEDAFDGAADVEDDADPDDPDDPDDFDDLDDLDDPTDPFD
jgi:hypothetical protein